jgi:hypothetical protein
VPDALQTHRTRPGRGAEPRATGPQPAPLPYVVGALLSGQVELALLRKASAGVARLEVVDDRLALVSAVLANRPGALVLPPFDAGRTSTAPLVLRVRREAPSVGVLVLTANPAGCGQPLLRAVHAGAVVLTSPTAEQLREALVEILPNGNGKRGGG